ncbi:hypothetical protein PSTT_09418, partial [Puccinia striiformis]
TPYFSPLFYHIGMRNDPRVVNGDTFGLPKPSMFTSQSVPETLLKNTCRISESNPESSFFFVRLALWHVVVTIPVLLLLSA